MRVIHSVGRSAVRSLGAFPTSAAVADICGHWVLGSSNPGA